MSIISVNDKQAIQDFNDKAGDYLAVSSKGGAKTLTVKHVGFFGKIFMKLGCHEASMKKVIRYLAANLDDTLDDNLKLKLSPKINHYAINHKFIVDPTLIQNLQIKPFNPPPPPPPPQIDDGYDIFKNLIQTQSLHGPNSFFLTKVLKKIDLQMWIDNKNVIKETIEKILGVYDDRIYPLIEQVLENRIDQLDKELDFTHKVVGREKAIMLDDLMQPSNKSVLKIKLLPEQELKDLSLAELKKLTQFEVKGVISIISQLNLPSKAIEELNELAYEDKVDELEEVLKVHSGLNTQLEEKNIKTLLDKKSFSKALFGLIFTDTRMHLFTKENIDDFAALMEENHFKWLTAEQAGWIKFATILTFTSDQVYAFYTTHRTLLQNLKKDELNALIQKFPDSLIYAHITDEQVGFLDPSGNFNQKTFKAIFGDNGYNNPSADRIKILSPENAQALFQWFDWCHFNVLTDDQIKGFDYSSFDKSRFKDIFSKHARVALLSNDQISELIEFMQKEHFVALSKAQVEKIAFEDLEALDEDQLVKLFEEYPDRLQALNQEQINKIIAKYPSLWSLRRISDDQLHYLDPKIMTQKTFTVIFGDSSSWNSDSNTRIKLLSGKEAQALFDFFTFSHTNLLENFQLKEFDYSNFDSAKFNDIFYRYDRVKALDDNQVALLFKFMKEEHFKALDQKQVDKINFSILVKVPEHLLEKFYELYPSKLKGLNKADLQTLISTYPSLWALRKITDEQLVYLDKTLPQSTFKIIFGDSHPSGDKSRIPLMKGKQAQALLELFGYGHRNALTDAQLKEFDYSTFDQEHFNDIFYMTARLKALNDGQIAQLVKFMKKEHFQALEKPQAAKIQYSSLKSLSDTHLNKFFEAHPERFSNLTQADLNEMQENFPEISVWNNISNAQIPLLDPIKISGTFFKRIFGDNSSWDKSKQERIKYLLPKQSMELFQFFNSQHFASLEPAQIKAMDLTNVDPKYVSQMKRT